ncbi:hypothetical protein SAMN03080617_02008 [Algoriphagus alkaliphilus]|uniref:Uncharacterized protein n=1 Tax=Algoriphagus alkaliphilus TaxID=279824 RepID=A0A1G5XUI4_9BACT|nr:hypothetical protein SAMN03080617_02008 [Algoriphagus alkaliphilus]
MEIPQFFFVVLKPFLKQYLHTLPKWQGNNFLFLILEFKPIVKMGNVDWKLAKRLLIPGVIGSVIGAFLLSNVDGDLEKQSLLFTFS